MKHPLRFSIALLTGICLAGNAYAAPPEDNTDVEILTEKIEDKLSDHKVEIAKSSARLKRKLDKRLGQSDSDMSEEIDVVMDVLEEGFADNGLFRNIAAMLGDFADDIDIESEDGDTTISFDGAKVVNFQVEKTQDNEDNFSISGLGKAFSLNREEIVKDGKTKTRITIDIDGGDEVDITLPEIK